MLSPSSSPSLPLGLRRIKLFISSLFVKLDASGGSQRSKSFISSIDILELLS